MKGDVFKYEVKKIKNGWTISRWIDTKDDRHSIDGVWSFVDLEELPSVIEDVIKEELTI